MAKVNTDLARERQKATFDTQDITFQLYTKKGTELRRMAYQKVEEEPEFRGTEKFPIMSREETYDKAVRATTVMVKNMAKTGYLEEEARDHYISATMLVSHPFALQYGMFIPTIKGQGTDEQIQEFVPRAKCLEIIGTYAQTELGHGTFIRGLETTATYDQKNEQFVINSPTLSSMKYWPGNLGKTCNYAVVMAQLIINDKNYGLHAFMCQLRDFDSHQPLPGVELGDINAKFGYGVVDNGYLRFNQYRIPRKNMLMRFAQVKADGTYNRQVMPQTTYLTMTYVRMAFVKEAAKDLGRVATIATRYSAVRRQTANTAGVEPQILDYQTQQMKLFPAISTSYALYFTGMFVEDIYQDTMAAVKSGDTIGLPELHMLTSGLKAFATETACELMETCRRACGGHGYSHASGIPAIYLHALPNCTAEGENTVMYLQCARSLVKFLRKALAGERLPHSLEFLAQAPTTSHKLSSAQEFDLPLYLEAVRTHTLRSLVHQLSGLNASSKLMSSEMAWNHHSADLVEVAKAFSFQLTVTSFVDILLKKQWEKRALAVMQQLCQFYIVNGIIGFSGSFIQHEVLSCAQIQRLSSRRIELLSELRPNAVALVDAFDYPDRLLNSCLGRYDGNVYEALYEYAKSSPLNQQQVHPSYYKYVKPLQQKLSKL